MPRYQSLLTQISRLDNGVKFLASLRSDVIVSSVAVKIVCVCVCVCVCDVTAVNSRVIRPSISPLLTVCLLSAFLLVTGARKPWHH